MSLVSNNNNLYNSGVNFQQEYTNNDSLTLKANLSNNKKCKQKSQVFDTNEQLNKPGANYNTPFPICIGCHLPIQDQYVYKIMNSSWHEDCLKCCQCGQVLKETCFNKNDLFYCKEDYIK